MSRNGSPLFCGGDMAARIEEAEASAIVAATEVAMARGSGGFVRGVGGGTACFAETGSPLNKVVGVGFGGVPSVGEWEAVEEAYARVGCPVQVELAQLAEPGIAEGLTGRGYRLMSFENVLGMRLDGGEWAVPEGVEVRLDAGDDLDAWLDVVVDGFAYPDEGPVHEEFPRAAIAAVMRDMASVGETRRYLAYRDGVAAGGASVRIDGGIAALAGAATLLAHRRRGVQTALLATRLADAARAGCELATVTTAPGSKSQQNAQSQGFSLLYTRAILVKDH